MSPDRGEGSEPVSRPYTHRSATASSGQRVARVTEVPSSPLLRWLINRVLPDKALRWDWLTNDGEHVIVVWNEPMPPRFHSGGIVRADAEGRFFLPGPGEYLVTFEQMKRWYR